MTNLIYRNFDFTNGTSFIREMQKYVLDQLDWFSFIYRDVFSIENMFENHLED